MKTKIQRANRSRRSKTIGVGPRATIDRFVRGPTRSLWRPSLLLLSAAYLIQLQLHGHSNCLQLSSSGPNSRIALPDGQQNVEQEQHQEEVTTVSSLELLPSRKSLFGRDSIDLEQLNQIDCHLRNVDFCYAGLMGASWRMMPETDAELEARCDEMRVTSSCLAIYNQRCSSYKAFGAISPMLMSDQIRSQALQQPQAALVAQMEVPLDFESPESTPGARQAPASPVTKVKLADFMNLCEPEAKSQPNIIKIRRRLFSLSKCLNGRLPKLAPCLDDLKVALQLLYEPSRVLPLRPSCCALSRFRHCATQAMDNVCGLSSFKQLADTFSNGSPTGSSLKLVERVCRNSTDFESEFCQEVLPPPGTKIPPKRGSKASKLAKALDLLSFSSATSSSSSSLGL